MDHWSNVFVAAIDFLFVKRPTSQKNDHSFHFHAFMPKSSEWESFNNSMHIVSELAIVDQISSIQKFNPFICRGSDFWTFHSLSIVYPRHVLSNASLGDQWPVHRRILIEKPWTCSCRLRSTIWRKRVGWVLQSEVCCPVCCLLCISWRRAKDADLWYFHLTSRNCIAKKSDYEKRPSWSRSNNFRRSKPPINTTGWQALASTACWRVRWCLGISFAWEVFQPNQCQALQEPSLGAVGEFILRTTKTVRLYGEIWLLAKFVQHVAVVWQYVALTSNSSHNTYATMVWCWLFRWVSPPEYSSDDGTWSAQLAEMTVETINMSIV